MELVVLPGEAVELPGEPGLIAGLTGGRLHRLEIAGRRIERRSPALRVRAGLAVVSGAPVAPELRVVDHLAAVVPAEEAAELLASAPLLAHRGADPAGVLSGGERLVLAWLVACAVAPRAVVLDRAGAGLDAATLRWAHGVVDGWLDAGIAVAVRVGRIEERRWLTHRADGTPR